jgi:hypothetical protein
MCDVSLIEHPVRLVMLRRLRPARRGWIHLEHPMPQPGARSRSTLVSLLLGLVACEQGAEPVPAGPPARIEVTEGATFAGSVGTVLATPLGVRVLAEDGRPVPGAVVRFSIAEGPGSVSPQSAATGRAGTAQTRLTFGAAAGAYRVLAIVTGVDVAAVFAGTAAPRASARVVVTPGQARLVAVGDTLRLRARRYDAFGNVVAGGTMTWASADPDVFTIDQEGLATGLRALAVGRAVASADGQSDTAFVVVANPDASPCLGYPAPITLTVGQSIDLNMTDGACIASAGPDDEYVVIPWHGSTVSTSTVALRVTGSGLAPVVATQSLAAPGGELSAARTASGPDADPPRGFALERRIREMGRREVMPLARRARGSFGTFGPVGAPVGTAARPGSIPARLAVGDVIELNANARISCTSPSLRTGRVAAVGARAIVVHDTANPAGGFTDADYGHFAATFDTLVAPVDEGAFGAPTDVDRNGRIVIFFTRAVNELTPPASPVYFGGFFHPRDLLPKEQNGASLCAGSNEGEMFYMLVPDTGGVVNGNKRRVGFVDSVTIGTLAHEYQHLINAGRRAYVNNAIGDEEVWLNEGLSHIAEELVFHRVAGVAPRQNLGGERFGTQPYDPLFTQYMAANFARLAAFLESPRESSPYSASNDLATRGATWAFLRYAADRRGIADGDVWMRLANSTTAGLQNLQAVFGDGVLGLVRDWVVSLYADDYIAGVLPSFTQPSWNFRTAFLRVPGSPRSYPLLNAVRSMTDEASHQAVLRGGGGAFYRFSVAPGREASIRVTASGVAPPPTVRATILRRR